MEARLLGHAGVGVEIDPVARLIAKVKATPVADSAIMEAQDAIKEWIERTILCRRSTAPLPLPEVRDRDYWFRADVSEALVMLSRTIAATPMHADIRDFFGVALSSVIKAAARFVFGCGVSTPALLPGSIVLSISFLLSGLRS